MKNYEKILQIDDKDELFIFMSGFMIDQLFLSNKTTIIDWLKKDVLSENEAKNRMLLVLTNGLLKYPELQEKLRKLLEDDPK